MSRRLVVLASEGARDLEPLTNRDCVVPLAPGSAIPEEIATKVLEAAAAAGITIRERFGPFLWAWVQRAEGLRFAAWNEVSWWWLTPLSEKSPLRSPLVNELYQLVLVATLLDADEYDELVWCGGERLIAAAARALARSRGVLFSQRAVRRRVIHTRVWLAARRMAFTVYMLVRYLMLRALGWGTIQSDADALLYTRFPILWEKSEDGWRERMFGEWPRFLTESGYRITWAASLTAGIRDLLTRGAELQRACRTDSIMVLDALATWREVLKAHLTLSLSVEVSWLAAARAGQPDCLRRIGRDPTVLARTRRLGVQHGASAQEFS